MISDTITLIPGRENVTLTTYISSDTPELDMLPHKAVLIMPGGGYDMVSDREAEPVALTLMARGYQAFVLRYSVGEAARFPQPLLEAALALSYIRAHAEEYHIYPDRVFVMGFSAGAHLAASLGTLWHDESIFGDRDESIKPTGMILAYPVVTTGPYAHRGSIDRVWGSDTSNGDCAARWSVERNVSADTAPAFIWHTQNDAAVPVRNSLLLATALEEHGVPYEMHIYDRGCHGLSVANTLTWVQKPDLVDSHIATWLSLADEWMQRNFPAS